ncbi:MAG: S-layer homology domain-containing protein, partial [Clostridia bacterium]|nr:S-layer homology domain-containing protein [Clostridia bacterium]
EFIFMPRELVVPEGIAEDYGFYNAEPGYEVGGVDHGAEEGEITALDAVVAAHIEAYGDASSIIGESSYITGMFGVEGSVGFSVDGKLPIGEMSDGYAINEYVLTEGETILFYNYADPYNLSDYASYFDVQSVSVGTGEEFELTLKGYQAMERFWYEPGTPTPEMMSLITIPGAEISIVKADGTLETLGKTTDDDGKVTLSFDTPGEYIVSASGFAIDTMSCSEVPIVAPICFVTVGDEDDGEQEPDIEPEPVPLNRVKISAETSNGSLDYVDFKDADGNPLENAELSINDKEINVVLPKDYNISGKVTAEFSLTQNASGLPYVTPKNGATGSSSNKAWNNRTNIYNTTLSKGAGTQKVYFYNLVPSATTNTYDTYTVNYKVKNELPSLANGVSSSVAAGTVAGSPYNVNLNEIFADEDGDALSYKVQIDGGSIVNADANYSFAPTLGGEYVLVFTADDGKETSTDTYTVMLTVSNSTATYDTTVLIPEGITPEFYITNGYETRVDILGDALESQIGENANGFVLYTVKVPENIDTISVRAKRDGVSLGGMSIPASENSSVSFREIHAFIPTQANGSYITSQQAVIEVTDKEGNFATVGANGTDEDGILYYTFFLAATGNDRLYTFYAKPIGDIASVYSTTQADNKAISADKADVYETSVELSYKSAFKLNVPSYAGAKAFYQNKNYNVMELTPLEIKDEEDGTKTYYFHVSSGSDAYSYRVFCEGKITKAGYISGSEKKVSWSDEDAAPDAKIAYDKTSTFGSRGDDSLLLNINGQQRLVLSKDETFKLRAYRIWQIINNDTMNKMIEPDFTYNILSGSDIISVVPVTSGNGNAKNNWLNITAIGEGTAILEIGYNALDIVSGNMGGFNGLSEFTFSACDEARKGLVVVQTANAATDVEFGIKSKSKWDAEFDTLYFTGEYATLKFAPTVTQGSISKVEFSNDKGESWTEIKKKDDVYTARIISGNNLLRVTKDDGTTSYQVVRGDKVTVLVTNVTNPDKTLAAGDTARITLDGVHFPMGKMSGIYNPGYGYGHKITYTMGESQVQTDGTFQYNFPTNAYVDITIPDDAKPGDSINLTDGYIYFNNMGSAPGEHRNITDAGVSTNMGAAGSHYSRSILPDVTITLKAEDVGDGYNPGDDGGDDNSGSSGDEPTTPDDSIDTSNLKFDISGSEIKGYVTVSFTDNGKRKSNENGVVYKSALGEIIEEVRVPFKSRDTVASITLRLLKALDIKATYTGTATSNFYLSSIGNFTLNGKYYPSFGEFDSGAASGWMVKHNNWFINMGAAEFAVEDGDTVEWLYTCRLGADIGCDWSNPSAEISGIKFKSNYGTLSPAFGKDVTEYTYTVSSSTKSICLKAELENYWAKVTYKSGNKTYKAMEEIPVSDGTVITIESSFAQYMGHTPTDTDSVKITIKKSSDSLGGGGGSGSGSAVEEDDKNQSQEAEKTDEPVKDDEAQENLTFSETTFADVKKDDWHYESVKYVYENNLMQGTGNGFEPESKMSRAMLVTVLYRMTNTKNGENNYSFLDVPQGQWYSDAVSWAAANGIVNGINRAEFAPDSDVSREQMALIIYRFAKMQGLDVGDGADISAFADMNDVSDWALDAIKWANKTELVNGTSETTLSPKATATRAQVAAILMRFCENVAK